MSRITIFIRLGMFFDSLIIENVPQLTLNLTSQCRLICWYVQVNWFLFIFLLFWRHGLQFFSPDSRLRHWHVRVNHRRLLLLFLFYLIRIGLCRYRRLIITTSTAHATATFHILVSLLPLSLWPKWYSIFTFFLILKRICLLL